VRDSAIRAVSNVIVVCSIRTLLIVAYIDLEVLPRHYLLFLHPLAILLDVALTSTLTIVSAFKI